MKNRTIVLKIILAVTFLVTGLFSQQVFDARGAGMAYSNAADTRGLGQVGLNPATLAIPQRFNFEMNLFSLNASVFNNSFTKEFYEQYFTTGDSLTAGDINDIYSRIPDNGLQGRFGIRANTLAFYTRNYSLSLAIVGNGMLQIPKEILELPLKGNELGRVYPLDNFDGTAWGGIAFNFSAAYPFSFEQLDFLDFFSAGMTFKYIAGLAYFDVVNSSGEFISNPDYVQMNANMEARAARGGSGIAFDVGVFGRYKEKWSFSLTLLNPIGTLKWQRDTERVLFKIQTGRLTFPESFSDSVAADTSIIDTSYTETIGSFTTRLPVVLDIGVAYRWKPYLMFTAEYEQGLNSSMGGTTSPRLAMGAEYTGFPIIPLRTGFSIGGQQGFVFAMGFGINLHFWYLDFSFLNHNGIISSKSKGITLAVTTRLRF